MKNYKPTIGLEIHVQLKTKSKMFCNCKNDPDQKKPNTNVCPFCLGHPGVLPVANKAAIQMVLKVGKALHCKIAKNSKFDRKNYFYPDLPKGYQISQYNMPLCEKGWLIVSMPEPAGCPMPRTCGLQKKKIRITRIHLEEDTGKLLHKKNSSHSLIDFNRSGVSLMELVTEPNMHSASEAGAFCRELQLILRYLRVSNADMEKGEMRCEVNISLAPMSSQKLGTKVEIKNLNSFKAVEQSIEYEIKRQTKVLQDEEKVIQETMGWDTNQNKTFPQRTKEKAHDYRYFPEPDLPPLQSMEHGTWNMEELPDQRRKRFKKHFGLKQDSIETLVREPDLADYFENTVSDMKNWVKSDDRPEIEDDILRLIQLTANYLLTELKKLMYEAGTNIVQTKITPENFAEFICLIHQGKISSSGAQIVLLEMFKTGGDPSHIIEEKELVQVSDESTIEKLVERVIANNPKPVADFKAGKDQVLKFLVGQVMQETKARANPTVAEKILKSKLE